MITIGVIGYGYWGPNIVRNFNSAPDARVGLVCDKNPATHGRITRQFPGIGVCSDAAEVLASPDIDAVAIVTPVSTHYPLAVAALKNGKHIFVEKPFTATVAEAQGLIELAEKKNLRIMVDHTFLFTGAVKKIHDLIGRGELGDIYYFDSTRVNLGLFQHDVNVIWDLAPHDFSIMQYLLGKAPVAVTATGMAHVNDHANIAWITVHFSGTLIAHFTVNWLSPVKVRNLMIGGEKKMLVWNDVNPDQKICIYDKGVDVNGPQGIYDLLVSYRSGDMWVPRVEQTEALSLGTRHFLECVESGARPLCGGPEGLEVVRLLEACDASMKQKGKLIEL